MTAITEITSEELDTRTGPNVVLLEIVYEFIKANPQTWIQSEWRCKSGMCFAGHATQFAGASWTYPLTADGIKDSHFPCDDVTTPDGEVTSCEDFAQEVLGLTEREADALFAPGNDLPTIRTVLDIIEAGGECPKGGWSSVPE